MTKLCTVEGCDQKRHANGFCQKHNYRFKKYGDPLKVSCVYGDSAARLRERSQRTPDGCLEWGGAISTNGYGRTTHKDKPISAHRLSYQLHKGEIPEGLFVCHSCDNRRCVEPSHLFLANHKGNMEDMAQKGRGTRGERNNLAKLSNRDVVLIKNLLDLDLRQNLLARVFGVNKATINSIATGRNWSWMENQ